MFKKLHLFTNSAHLQMICLAVNAFMSLQNYQVLM